MRLLITGSTGYIGERVVKTALRYGYDVVSMSRRSPAVSLNVSWVPYDLEDCKVEAFHEDTTAIIHLATDSNSILDKQGSQEISNLKLLLSATNKVGGKFIFVSSQTARANAPTAYGRTKWNLEKEVLAAGGWVVRPGLVYGGCERGLFGVLVGITRRFPILPAFIPIPKVQPIHVDDLAEGLLRIVKCENTNSRVLCLGSVIPISFTRFILSIAAFRLRRRRLIVPVPTMLVRVVGIIVSRRLGLLLGVEQLKSLFELPQMNTATDLRQLGLNLRSLSSGLSPSGDDKRRRLLCEGQAMLNYVLKERPSIGLMRRYVCAVEKLRGDTPIALPAWSVRWPITLALFDSEFTGQSTRGKEFIWRLDAATVLAEATQQGARQFLGVGKNQGRLMSLISILCSLMSDSIWRVLRLLFSPILKRYMLDEKGC